MKYEIFHEITKVIIKVIDAEGLSVRVAKYFNQPTLGM